MAVMRCFCLFLLAALTGVLSAATPPNIVFIMADDLGWADVAFHGGNAPTPNLDQLAKEGLELTQHYVAPVCSPTRAGLMTGRCWSRFGVTTPNSGRALPWETVTLPKALKTLGYDTCLTGKWHLGSKPDWGPSKFGFDHSYGSLGGGVGPYNHRYKQGEFTHTWHRNGELIEEQGHATDLITQEALKWLGQRDSNPFFLYVPFTAVHLPLKEPEEWLKRVPAGITDAVARHYAACILHQDWAVGRIIEALEKSGHRQNTLVIFTSDNGGSTAENNDRKYPADDYVSGSIPGNNTPLRGQKGDLYEGGIRVPTIVSWPGTLKAGRFDTPMQITDWMPTFCALAGYQSEADLKWDGTDFWPALSGQKAANERLLYWAGPGFRASAIRQGDWKLVVTRRKGQPDGVAELFNLARDPEEKQDLATQQPDQVSALKARLKEVAKADRDSVVNEPAAKE
ncbi:Arylsulfatase A [Prosthecobacter debontii]|uniref:Arylsulfatase A n=1 Tax=Prosthecobacter debontii TaxID=48467 RepID=A0A1T4Y5V6_9BACT|nr:Arylsulfatase A [Prosthecobacter debontii]